MPDLFLLCSNLGCTFFLLRVEGLLATFLIWKHLQAAAPPCTAHLPPCGTQAGFEIEPSHQWHFAVRFGTDSKVINFGPHPTLLGE